MRAGWILLALAVALPACGGPNVATDLELRRVVLYRNGVGYFERSGHVDDPLLRFQVRRDQVGDFLSSLAVVTGREGGVRGVSFPSLAEPEPPPPPPPCYRPAYECPPPPVPIPPDPMIDVDVELDGESHDVTVAYVVGSPVWRPTYRILLGRGEQASLLQGWAVVQNLSGESWNDVNLTVTTGAPLTFQADLATPYTPVRPVVTDFGELVQAPVSSTVSMSTEESQRWAPAPPPAAASPYGTWAGDVGGYYGGYADDGSMGGFGGAASGRAVARTESAYPSQPSYAPAPGYGPPPPPPPPPMGIAGASRSLALLAARVQEGGITRYEAEGSVTVPEDSSTLIAILNDPVAAKDTLLYQPDSGVPDSYQNPFRVVRFQNDTGVTLERGPVAILGSSQFLGQGILEPLPPGATTSIPYALERAVGVTVTASEEPDEGRLVRVVHGRVTIQRFSQYETVYEARNLGDEDQNLWIHHARRSGYDLADRPEDTEELDDGSVLVPLAVPADETAKLELIEKTPVRVEVELLTPLAHDAIVAYLSGPAIDAVAGPVLRRVIEVSDRLAEMDRERAAVDEKRRQIQQTMQEIRADLSVLGTTPRAVELRNRLTGDLDDLTTQFQDLTAQIVDLSSRANEMRVELGEAVRDLDLTVPDGEDEAAE